MSFLVGSWLERSQMVITWPLHAATIVNTWPLLSIYILIMWPGDIVMVVKCENSMVLPRQYVGQNPWFYSKSKKQNSKLQTAYFFHISVPLSHYQKKLSMEHYVPLYSSLHFSMSSVLFWKLLWFYAVIRASFSLAQKYFLMNDNLRLIFFSNYFTLYLGVTLQILSR